MVLLKQNSERNEWLMAIIEEVVPESNDTVISVKPHIGKSNRGNQSHILKRLVHKIVLLVEKKEFLNERA